MTKLLRPFLWWVWFSVNVYFAIHNTYFFIVAEDYFGFLNKATIIFMLASLLHTAMVVFAWRKLTEREKVG